ncbi:MAG: LTA synthase family protein [Pseudobdellovibrio sp.]
MSLIPVKALRVICGLAILFFHLGLIFISMVDIELINFMGRRFTKASLYLAKEGQTSNLAQYGFLSLMTFLFLVATLWVSLRGYLTVRASLQGLKGYGQKIFLVVAMIPLVVIAGRGGLQLKPMSFVDAKVIDHPFSHHLILNTGFTFIKSYGKNTFQKEKYFSEEKMLSLLNQDSSESIISHESFKAQGYNLVIFIVESLSQEYLSKEQTPFLSKLAEEGVYFDKSYANGRRSIEGIASILAGIPALMEEPFLNSEFATNDFIGLGQLLRKKNYHTSFFHGAKNGSMRFDVFTKASGFDNYYGKNEFPDPSQDDGYWGIYDKPFLNFSCETMSQFQEPFASVVFTLSSHQPFKVPDSFAVPEGAQSEPPILKSISYTDSALKGYFECARNKKWFDKTIFVVVADHTGPALNPDKANFEDAFKVPLIFYSAHKEVLKGLDSKQYAQQIDILPTLNDLLDLGLISDNHLSRSLYKTGRKTIALFSDHQYQLVGDTDLSEDRLKAIKQYFSEGLYDNRLYYPHR